MSEVVDGQLVPTGITTNGIVAQALLDERLYDIDWTANRLVVWAEQADGTWAIDVTDGPVNDCGFVAQPDEVRCGDVTVAVTPARSGVARRVGRRIVGSSPRADGVSAAWTIELDGNELSLDDCVDSGCEQYLQGRLPGHRVDAARSNPPLARTRTSSRSCNRVSRRRRHGWSAPARQCRIVGADSTAIYTLGAAASDAVGARRASLHLRCHRLAHRSARSDDRRRAGRVSRRAGRDADAGRRALVAAGRRAASDARLGVRSEYADSPAQLHDYVQTWMGEGAGGPVLTIETNIGQAVGTSNGDPIELSPWDRATVPLMAPGLRRAAARGSVRLRQAVEPGVDAATTWSRWPRAWRCATTASPGWFTKNVPAGLTEIDGAWGTGVASRHVRWGGGPHGRAVDRARRGGHLHHAAVHRHVDQFVDIGGASGVAYAVDDRSAVIWSPEPGLVVLLALYGSVDDTIALARSVAPVDEATWLARTAPARPGQDGCNSMFC